MKDTSRISEDCGGIMIEAAVALPIFLFLIFTILSIAQIMEAKIALYDEVSKRTRELSTVSLLCGDLDLLSKGEAAKFEAGLATRGYSGSVGVYALDSAELPTVDPGSVAQWRVQGSVSAPCLACSFIEWLGAYSGTLSVSTTVLSENPGCS